jgi:hypothetical protein
VCVCVCGGGGVILWRYIYTSYIASNGRMMVEGVTPCSVLEVEVNFQRTTRRHITKDSTLHSHVWENFRSNKDKMADELEGSGRGLIDVLPW